MSRRRSISKDGGFTLIELLITLALLSLLTLALFGSLRFGTRVWEASATATASAEDIRDAQTIVSAAIANAYPKLVMTDARHARVDFQGEAQSLQVLAPDRSLPGALAHMTLAAEQTSSGLSLILREKPELAVPDKARTQVLVNGLQSVAFAYFGQDKPREDPAWHDRWQDQTRLPAMVRIRATFASARTVWPDLIVTPHIAADVGCTFDPLTHFCQGR